MAKPLPTISSLSGELDKENAFSQEIEQSDVESALATKQKKKQHKDSSRKGENKPGIQPKSPTVYLLPEEKNYLLRLKAALFLESGEKLSGHQLVMSAIYEYAKKHVPEFYKTMK